MENDIESVTQLLKSHMITPAPQFSCAIFFTKVDINTTMFMNDLHVALANGGNVLRALRGRVPECTGAEAITKVMASELIYKEGTTLKGNKPPKPWLRPLALFSLDSPHSLLPVTSPPS